MTSTLIQARGLTRVFTFRKTIKEMESKRKRRRNASVMAVRHVQKKERDRFDEESCD